MVSATKKFLTVKKQLGEICRPKLCTDCLARYLFGWFHIHENFVLH